MLYWHNGVIKVDCEQIAKEYLFIDLAVMNMQLDVQRVYNGDFKIKGPYVYLIEEMISKAINERRKLKQVMYQNKIRIEFKKKQWDFSLYMIYVGKSERKISFSNAIIKKNVREVMMRLATN